MAALVKRRRGLEWEFVLALVIALMELMLMVVRVSRCSLDVAFPVKLFLSICVNIVCISSFHVGLLRRDLPGPKNLLHAGYALARLYFGTLEMFDVALGDENHLHHLLLSEKLPLIVALAVVLLLLFEDDIICKCNPTSSTPCLNQIIPLALANLKDKLGLGLPSTSASSTCSSTDARLDT